MPLTRKKTFSWWGIVLFAATAFTLLYLLFPKTMLLSNIMNDDNTSPLTIAYLNDLIEKNPDNIDYKISLTRQEMKMGHLNTAKHLLERYMTQTLSTKARWQFQFLNYQIMRTETFALKPNNPKRIQYEKQLSDLIPSFQTSPELTGIEAALLGDDALAMGTPQLALVFYKKALKDPKLLRPSFYEHVGQVALFVSDYQTSADFYLMAMQVSPSKTKKRVFLIKALNSLKTGKRFDQALTLIKQYDTLINQDRALLVYVVNLGLSANQPKLAEKYISKVLLLKYKK